MFPNQSWPMPSASRGDSPAPLRIEQSARIGARIALAQ